jgi:uncharacterized protein (TIGR02145 family)
MKKIASLFLILSSLIIVKAQQTDSIIDIRDDQVYKVVKIGQQWWMQENLNLGTRIVDMQPATNNGEIEKYCYDDLESNCDTYGGLYQWDEMMDYYPSDNGNPGITQGICPVGWHLPTDSEWTELTDFLGGESIAGGMLKETGTVHWESPNEGANNESGFTALPGGYSDGFGTFYYIGSEGYWWSATDIDAMPIAWSRNIYYNYSNVYRNDFSWDEGFSVRCLRDSCQFSYLTISDENLKTITKIDFNDEQTVDTIIIINSNAGETININSIQINNPVFNLDKSSVVLSQGESIHLIIAFTPDKGKHYLDTIKITSDDPYQPLISIPLHGFLKPDSIIDIRDGQVYKIVKIGRQWWMQENVNIGSRIDGSHNATDNGLIEKYCYLDNEIYCDTFGGLYLWDEMMDYYPSDDGNPGITQGICPFGWHLPTDKEWKELEIFLGMSQADAETTGYRGTNEGGKMKETGSTQWRSPNTGATNESGFSVLPCGSHDTGGYIDGVGDLAFFWSSTEYSSLSAWYRLLIYDNSAVYRNYSNKDYGFSVRCLMDSCQFSYLTILDEKLDTISKLDFTYEKAIDTIIIINSSGGRTIQVNSIHTNTSAYDLSKTTASLLPGESIHLKVTFNPHIKGKYYPDTLRIESDDPYKPVITIPLTGYMKTDTIIDVRDRQVYSIVKIGKQWWLQENLNIGTIIIGIQDPADNGTIEKYCYEDLESNCNIYGGLYQWDEMMDYYPSEIGNPGLTQGICPIGWHLPTDSEWTELTDFLGGEDVAGGKMKDTSLIHWNSPNTGATNESGFTVLPGGDRSSNGYFSDTGKYAYFWSSTEYSSTSAWYQLLYSNSSGVYRSSFDKDYGLSVRCLRDSCQLSYLTVSDINFRTVSDLNFYGDNNSKEIILINSSAGKTINISSIYTNNFVYKLNKSSSNLSPGDSIQLIITFDPSIKDIYPDTLFVESDDPYDSLITILLNGTFPPEISFTDSTNISCFGYSDGTATATPSLGTPPYQYQWDDPGNTTDSIVTGLSPNIYYHVTVTDSLVWSVTDSIMLSEPDSLEIIDAITNVTNTGGNNGVIDITVTGGIEPYDYLWSNDSTSEDLVGIKTGEYQLLVEDHNGCTQEEIFRVKEPINLQFDKTDASCYGFNDGWIDMTIVGGNQPYTIAWSNDAITEDIGNLQSGKYIVSVTDDFGVSATDSVNITEPELLEINPTYSDTICLYSNDGFISTDPSGGTSPYDYIWSTDAVTQVITALEAGDYSVKVTDSHGCVDSADFTIYPAAPYDGEKICIVTVDLLSGRNLIVWEKTPDKGIAWYKLYRENTLMDSVDYDDLSIFLDTVADPEKRPYLYRISIVDTCGNESAQSPYHKPLFLQYTSSEKGVNLTWSKYEIEGEVINFSSYTIYRGSDSTVLSPLEEDIPKEVDIYTDNDPNALTMKYFYRVAGNLTDPCYPSGSGGKKAESGPYSHSMSNMEDNRFQTGTSESLFSNENLMIIPNPLSETTTLIFHNPEGQSYTLYIMDLSGKVCRIVKNINTAEYILKRDGLKEGFYFLELRGPEVYRGKMVIE